MTSRPLSLLTQGEWDAIDEVLRAVSNRAVADYRRQVRRDAAKSSMYNDRVAELSAQVDALKAQWRGLTEAYSSVTNSYEALRAERGGGLPLTDLRAELDEVETERNTLRQLIDGAAVTEAKLRSAITVANNNTERRGKERDEAKAEVQRLQRLVVDHAAKAEQTEQLHQRIAELGERLYWVTEERNKAEARLKAIRIAVADPVTP